MNIDHNFNSAGYCENCSLRVEWAYGRKCSQKYQPQFYQAYHETLPSVPASNGQEVAVPNNQGVDHHE